MQLNMRTILTIAGISVGTTLLLSLMKKAPVVGPTLQSIFTDAANRRVGGGRVLRVA